MTAAVTRFGGHVAKYLGDGLMVYFGWREAHEDDAERAVRAGLAIVDEVDRLNGRLAVEHEVPLSVRIGNHAGPVVMGHGGGEEADVFGDATNVASRVQSAADPGSVLITSASTHAWGSKCILRRVEVFQSNKMRAAEGSGRDSGFPDCD